MEREPHWSHTGICDPAPAAVRELHVLELKEEILVKAAHLPSGVPPTRMQPLPKSAAHLTARRILARHGAAVLQDQRS